MESKTRLLNHQDINGAHCIGTVYFEILNCIAMYWNMIITGIQTKVYYMKNNKNPLQCIGVSEQDHCALELRHHYVLESLLQYI